MRAQNGNVTFGEAPDTSLASTPIKSCPIDPSTNGYWTIKSVNFTIGHSTVIDLTMDTATSLTQLPADIVDAWHKTVPGAARNDTDGTWTLPCQPPKALPNLYFYDPSNPGYPHYLYGSAFIGNQLPPSSSPSPSTNTNMCLSLLAPATINDCGGGMCYFPGWAFFSTHYTWFNAGNATNVPSLSFARDSAMTGAVGQNVLNNEESGHGWLFSGHGWLFAGKGAWVVKGD